MPQTLTIKACTCADEPWQRVRRQLGDQSVRVRAGLHLGVGALLPCDTADDAGHHAAADEEGEAGHDAEMGRVDDDAHGRQLRGELLRGAAVRRLEADRPAGEVERLFLDLAQILTSQDLHVASVPPALTPRVLHQPILLARQLLPIADHHHRVPAELLPLQAVVDSDGPVRLEVRVDIHAAIQRMTRGQSPPHLVLAPHDGHAPEDPVRVALGLGASRKLAAAPRSAVALGARGLEVVDGRAAAAHVGNDGLAPRTSAAEGGAGAHGVAALAPETFRVATHDALHGHLVALPHAR
mmetsp:Transcript_116157/g.335449  ORF Transcript_116157/g.335449 Transcript_116157/m.335449 type:complete len:296 (-) Transcript_116157:1205-2092(-)